MQESEVLPSIIDKTRRALVIWRCVQLLLIALTSLAILLPGGLPWAIAAFLAVFLSVLAWAVIMDQFRGLLKLSTDPGLAYWISPIPGGINKYVKQPAMTVHLRDGTSFCVRLPVQKMTLFVEWLSAKNPALALGSYYDFPQNKL